MLQPVRQEELAAEATFARPLVTIADAAFTWPGPAAFTLAVENLRIGEREKLFLLGPSGSGKSTLLSLLAGIITPGSGMVSVLGTEIAKLSGAGRDRFRAQHMGIIFQMFNLLPYGSAIDNVALPLHFAPSRRQRVLAQGSVAEEARRLLQRLGLDEAAIAESQAASLSVGQQQRVAAARALIGRPELVIADEPTSALDRASQRAFIDLLFEEVTAAGAALVMVSHDESLAKLFDRTLRLADIATTRRKGVPQ